MQFLELISEFIIPVFLFSLILHGLLTHQNIYEHFLTGAKEGLSTAIGLLPTLIGLLTSVGILRASGFLDFLASILSHVTQLFFIPSEIIPLILVKLFSGSAATGLLLDLYKNFGTDSYIGLAASILCSCTETLFYTLSIYFLHIKVKKTGFTIPGALFATLAGVAASLVLAYHLV